MRSGVRLQRPDGPTAIHRWATNRRDWLEESLALSNGIPSRECIRRVLIALQPEAFRRCFREWVADTLESDAIGPSRLVAIDGKTCRRSHDAAHGLGPLHIVSAWAREHGIALGQVAAEEKSNEITAIPLLLKQIELNEVRFYTLSRFLSGKRFGEAVRGHGNIASMHGVLDVAFRDDDSRVRGSGPRRTT